MSLASAVMWVGVGATMAVLNALAIALTMRRLPSSSNGAQRLVTRTLPLRLALQGLALFGAVRCGPFGVLGWLLGYLVGRTVVVGWALRHVEALGSILRQG